MGRSTPNFLSLWHSSHTSTRNAPRQLSPAWSCSPCGQTELHCHRHCKLQDSGHLQDTAKQDRGCEYFDPCSSSETPRGAMGMPLMQGPHASPQAATMVAVPALPRQQRSSQDSPYPQEGKHHVPRSCDKLPGVAESRGAPSPRWETLAPQKERMPTSSPLPKKSGS